MDWGLLEDNQKFKISIPVGKMSVKETEALLKQLNKMFPDIRMKKRRLKLDKIMEKINEKRTI